MLCLCYFLSGAILWSLVGVFVGWSVGGVSLFLGKQVKEKLICNILLLHYSSTVICASCESPQNSGNHKFKN
jgi:hypothetical protein